jgi:hypothetical protein
MKRKLIIALIFVNAALLVALAVGTSPQQAQAQTFPTTDYIMMTAQINQALHVVCVIDLASRRMTAWRLRQPKAGARFTMTQFRGRDLDRDFDRKKTVAGP